MERINVATCELTDGHRQGRFRCRAEAIGERLGATLLGAAVYEMEAGDTNWPYHEHHGLEEWMYVVSGAPVLRERTGERPLAPGTLVAFAAGPLGAHTVAGPGRVVIFSAGQAGWGSAWASVYPDSDKISAAGALFRRADALASWEDPMPEPVRALVPDDRCPAVDLMATDVAPLSADWGDGSAAERCGRGRRLAPLLGTRTWAGTVWELASGESSGPYHYDRRREEWALVLSGAPTLRHPEGEDVLGPCDIVGFPDGPAGAHRLSNDGAAPARVLVISTPVDRPMSAFYPDDGTVVVRLSDRQGFRFRLADRIEDYWDGEPGA